MSLTLMMPKCMYLSTEIKWFECNGTYLFVLINLHSKNLLYSKGSGLLTITASFVESGLNKTIKKVRNPVIAIAIRTL